MSEGERSRTDRSYLFDLGHVSDERLVVDELQDVSQLAEVGQEAVADSLQEQTKRRTETTNESSRMAVNIDHAHL